MFQRDFGESDRTWFFIVSSFEYCLLPSWIVNFERSELLLTEAAYPDVQTSRQNPNDPGSENIDTLKQNPNHLGSADSDVVCVLFAIKPNLTIEP